LLRVAGFDLCNLRSQDKREESFDDSGGASSVRRYWSSLANLQQKEKART